MIISVADVKNYITTTESDAGLEARLQALELLIRKYTNNNFQDRRYRTHADVSGNIVTCPNTALFAVGDTIMVEADLVVISAISGNQMTISESLLNDVNVLVTKVVYPIDVVMGAVNMLKWDLENRSKVGIQSETISRHSVTYFNMDGDNSLMGYPKSLLGFLKPYMKARF